MYIYIYIHDRFSPVSAYCDGVGCHVMCLQHGIPVWQHIGQSSTATNRHHCDKTSECFKVTLNPKQQTKTE